MKKLIVNDYPKSSIAESIKGIKTNLKFAQVNNKIKTILITSPNSGDGKSFISSNLAVTYANSSLKVLIIDCDLRKGSLSKIFESKSYIGFTNLLIDDEWDKNILKYLQKTEIDNLDILFSGNVPPDPTILFDSSKMDLVMNKLYELYDIIILDSPPVNGLSDSLILSRFVDSVVVVAKKGKTKFSDLEQAIDSLKKVNAKISGVVMNRCDSKTCKCYNGYYVL